MSNLIPGSNLPVGQQFQGGGAVLAGLAILAVSYLGIAHVAVPAAKYLLPEVETSPPPPPPSDGFLGGIPWSPDSDLNEETERYYDDMAVAEVLSRTGATGAIVIFGTDAHIRAAAMERLLQSLYLDLISQAFEGAVQSLEYQEEALQEELEYTQGGPIGMFRWQTKGELRRNMNEIKRTERSLTQLRQRARQDADDLSSWSPPTEQEVETSPNYTERRDTIEFSTGHAYEQLKHISLHGWTNQ